MTRNYLSQIKQNRRARVAKELLCALILLLAGIPLSATASTLAKPIFQGHNQNYWVGTYGCKGNPQETSELVAALKKALAAKTGDAAEQGIQEAIQTYRGCIIGTSDAWTPTAQTAP